MLCNLWLTFIKFYIPVLHPTADLIKCNLQILNSLYLAIVEWLYRSIICKVNWQFSGIEKVHESSRDLPCGISAEIWWKLDFASSQTLLRVQPASYDLINQQKLSGKSLLNLEISTRCQAWSNAPEMSINTTEKYFFSSITFLIIINVTHFDQSLSWNPNWCPGRWSNDFRINFSNNFDLTDRRDGRW